MHLITDGSFDGMFDGQGALSAMLSYHLEARKLVLCLPVARLGSDREWQGGSQLSPRPDLNSWSLVVGDWVEGSVAPQKDEVDAHLALRYGA